MNFLRKALGAVGDIGKKIAPGLVFIPGIGPVAAAGVGALSAAAGTLNDKNADGTARKLSLGRALKHAAGGAATGGIGGYALSSAAGGATGLSGLKAALMGSPASGLSTRGSLLTGAPGQKLSPVSVGSSGLLDRALGYLKEHPELAFQTMQAVGDSRAQASSDEARKRLLDTAASAPSRTAGVGTAGTDLTRVFRDLGNPYSRAA